MNKTIHNCSYYGKLAKRACLIGFALLCWGCTEFMEESLEDSSVVLLSPGEQAELSSYAVTFNWEHTEYALGYRLQVATPDFDSPTLFLADTLVAGLKFTLSLSPGRYQWRLRAENGSSKSSYVQRSFVLHEGALSRQQVLLGEPGSNWLSSSRSVTLGWEPLFAATSYRLQLDTANFQDEDTLVLDQELSGTAYTLQLEHDGLYQWRVQAANDTATSVWSDVRLFTIDTEAPAVPALRAPQDGANVSLPVTLSWDTLADADHYLLYVFLADGKTPLAANYPLKVAGASHSLQAEVDLGSSLVWQLRAVDRAGNQGALSVARSLVVTAIN